MLEKVFTEQEIDFSYKNCFKLFCIGIIFLGSAPFISIIFFVFPLLKGLIQTNKNVSKNKIINYLIISSILIFFQAFLYSFFKKPFEGEWTNLLNWAGIANWIPFFACFVGFQPYLNNPKKRKLIAKLFIVGTIPVLFSCLGQYWFQWYGPFEIFNGLIKWYQRPLIDNQNVTGLFSNPNYTGMWLTLILPFSLATLNEKYKLRNLVKKITSFFIFLAISISVIFTNSRSAFIGFFIAITSIYGKKSIKYFSAIALFLIFIYLIGFITLSTDKFDALIKVLIPENLVNKFSELIFNLDSNPRIKIWKSALKYILERPLLGWGSGSFPFLYFKDTGNWNGHTHNLFLDLALSYGLIVSSLIYLPTVNIIFSALKINFSELKEYFYYEKAWCISGLIFFLAHLYDVFYFDVRINFANWILITGIYTITNRD